MLYILSIVGLLIALVSAKPAGQPKICAAELCGDLVIEYPFGKAGTNCSYNQFFTVTCNSLATHKPKLFLTHYNLEVVQFIRMNINYPYTEGHMIVKVPVRTCEGANIHESSRWRTPGFNESSFISYDVDNNVFAFVGCGGKATLYDDKGTIMASCKSSCRPAETITDYGCGGYYCCQKDVIISSANVGSYFSIEVSMNKTGRCRSAFLISKIFAAANATVAVAMGSSAVPIQLLWNIYDIEPVIHDGDDISQMQLTGMIIVLIIAFGSLLLGPCCCFWSCWFFKTRKSRRDVKLRAKYFKRRLAQRISDREVVHKTKLFSMKELKKSTNNFNENRILGEGTQGIVYKGMLSDGQVVAIKRSKSFEESHWQEFINEVILLSQTNHRHVVKLLGCCVETKLPLVVYEFLCNGNLYEYIHSCGAPKFLLTWEMRLRVAFESAGAIAYLHSSSTTPIYHRDIKSTNILLDAKYQAKVSDFGISKGVAETQTHLTTCVRGTFGYIDPEYFESSHFSEKSDVYSFGVVLVEILTGQKPIREATSGEERSLVVYFVSAMDESRLDDILDPIVAAECDKEVVVRVANLAKHCLNPRGTERPTMNEVALELGSLRKKPTYTATPLQFSSEIMSVRFETSADMAYVSDSPSNIPMNQVLKMRTV